MSLSGLRGVCNATGTRGDADEPPESVIPVPPRRLTVKAFGITDRGKVR